MRLIDNLLISSEHSIQMQKNTPLSHVHMEHSPGYSPEHSPYHGSQIILSKFKKIDIVSSIFSDHNAIRLDINYKKKL